MLSDLRVLQAIRAAAEALRAPVAAVASRVFEGAEDVALAPLSGTVPTLGALSFLHAVVTSVRETPARWRSPVSVAAAVLLLRVLGLFSNSYIVAEGSIVAFMAMTLTLVCVTLAWLAECASLCSHVRMCARAGAVVACAGLWAGVAPPRFPRRRPGSRRGARRVIVHGARR